MPIELNTLCRNLNPEKTVLFFGAGSSVPSGAPSVEKLCATLRKETQIDNTSLTLSELSGTIEKRLGRQRLIEILRKCFTKRTPLGGLSNLALYAWKAIYTTNYDEIIETCYQKYDKPIDVITTDFDFSARRVESLCSVYKIHGTIKKDVSDGSQSRIIITNNDYLMTESYRESIYDKLRADIVDSNMIIIGYSLNDHHVKEVIDRALSIKNKLQGASTKISLLLFQRDEDRAALLEDQGIEVSFGGIDEFFAALASEKPDDEPDTDICEDILDQYPKIKAITVDVDRNSKQFDPDFAKMFHGSPATYADVRAGLTFERDILSKIAPSLLADLYQFATILGVSGVGKTTAARQIALRLVSEGWQAWEHSTSYDLEPSQWMRIARDLEMLEQKGVLVVDEAHFQIQQVCELADQLTESNNTSLKIIAISSHYQWNPRIKSLHFRNGNREHNLSRLSASEIERLLRLADSNETVRPLVDKTFGGYSYSERKRRLLSKCGSDMFVCLKNIFATEAFDEIILREYAELDENYSNIYRLVAALEHSGVRVHRQLIIRLLNIPAQQINTVLSNLEGIINEYDISSRDSIFGWSVRHPVIAGIIVKYKYYEKSELIKLFEQVIDAISPAFDIELRTVREICNTDTGIPSISDISEQNKLLRRMISRAPGERVPRHRLIRNLIEEGFFDIADQEIHQFKNDLGIDGPLARYEVKVRLARAQNAPGLLEGDRKAMLLAARDLAMKHVTRFAQNRSVHGIYCEVGIEWFKLTSDMSFFDNAISNFKEAEAKYVDEEMTKMIRTFERRISGNS